MRIWNSTFITKLLILHTRIRLKNQHYKGSVTPGKTGEWVQSTSKMFFRCRIGIYYFSASGSRCHLHLFVSIKLFTFMKKQMCFAWENHFYNFKFNVAKNIYSPDILWLVEILVLYYNFKKCIPKYRTYLLLFTLYCCWLLGCAECTAYFIIL